MTSTVKITFRALKDFTVEIDSIESVSPRGLELAFAAVEREYHAQKGILNRDRRQREAEDAKIDFAAEQEAIALASLKDQEHAAFDAEAGELALKVFNSKTKAEQKTILDAGRVDAQTDMKQEFLANLQHELDSRREQNILAKTAKEQAAEIVKDQLEAESRQVKVDKEIAATAKKVAKEEAVASDLGDE